MLRADTTTTQYNGGTTTSKRRCTTEGTQLSGQTVLQCREMHAMTHNPQPAPTQGPRRQHRVKKQEEVLHQGPNRLYCLE